MRRVAGVFVWILILAPAALIHAESAPAAAPAPLQELRSDVARSRADQLRAAQAYKESLERLLTLRDHGRVVFRRRVSIGAGDSPTPSARFHVSDQVSGSRWGLGCCIVVLSGRQPRLPAGWDGGDRLAIHGRASTSESIGAPTSAGCLHATEQTLRELARLPLGTPVVIHP